MFSRNNLSLTCQNFTLPSGITTLAFITVPQECLGSYWDLLHWDLCGSLAGGIAVSPRSCGVVGVARKAAWHQG